MDLIKNINNKVREDELAAAEAASELEKIEPKPTAGKPISDYLTDIMKKDSETE